MIEPGELADGADGGLDGAISVATELEVLDHALAKRGHRCPLAKRVRRHQTTLRHAARSPDERAMAKPMASDSAYLRMVGDRMLVAAVPLLPLGAGMASEECYLKSDVHRYAEYAVCVQYRLVRRLS